MEQQIDAEFGSEIKPAINFLSNEIVCTTMPGSGLIGRPKVRLDSIDQSLIKVGHRSRIRNLEF